MVQLSLSYYPDITQKQTDADVRANVVLFSERLAAQLTRDLRIDVAIDVLPVLSVADQYRAVLEGRSHIALMKPVAYVFAHEKRPGILPGAVALRPIDGKVGDHYFGQVYARRSLGFTSIADLAASEPAKWRLAYGDRFSTSNFLIPANVLATGGVHPFLFFRSVRFFGGHDFAAEAVYEGCADIGCGHDGVIKILAQKYPDAEDMLIQLGQEDIHSDPVVVDTDALPAPVTLAAIEKACVAISSDPEVLGALDLFWGWVKGLAPTRHENYASIESALKRLSLSDVDMVA
ncbi:ABC-type phosphate/phosphonate transport system substrate-binding protein [Sphingomonas kyeonggiensis]|uniref:phosphate/phosphite/phosphonate ABC transporter substrate-binding protein n=1 Tax=Sphingomonas kyeonggiensis TaxID=1268553 RepID=UPI00277E924B|nr:PhnD/SsuA/transferrin family substrate-binding protein [Sphingomonas kyeonggiensis]MDQ0251016.1 ABC-type phosphate/phosphonate transport system substrate-binding protein [Sphingomonas kyeonggiensis]